jgi:hypothetical protein
VNDFHTIQEKDAAARIVTSRSQTRLFTALTLLIGSQKTLHVSERPHAVNQCVDSALRSHGVGQLLYRIGRD